jgi:hypothetical protein
MSKQVPPLLRKDAKGKRALVVNMGLDAGREFFFGMDRGFEMVGFEPNPMSFPLLARKCHAQPTYHVVNLENVTLPLQQEQDHSYLVNACRGRCRTCILDGLYSCARLYVCSSLQCGPRWSEHCPSSRGLEHCRRKCAIWKHIQFRENTTPGSWWGTKIVIM